LGGGHGEQIFDGITEERNFLRGRQGKFDGINGIRTKLTELEQLRQEEN
jgi:hypothetical protein